MTAPKNRDPLGRNRSIKKGFSTGKKKKKMVSEGEKKTAL